jgi:POLQ-like helicase
MSSSGGLLMNPEAGSKTLLAVSRSKAKMYEYGIPEGHHIKIRQSPEQLFDLTIGILGELAAERNRLPKVDIDHVSDNINGIQFTAHFFDAHLLSRLNTELDQYLKLLGAASYYLSDLPGSSAVLVQQIDGETLDIGSSGIENLLWWVLKGDFSKAMVNDVHPYGRTISRLSDSLCKFFSTGKSRDIEDQMNILRSQVYTAGSPRELLMADTVCAVIGARIKNSTWISLPKYSGISTADWKPTIQKPTFISELWPAQRLLGANDVLRGISAIVQMPTSAGKTKATELIIRSAFLSGRTSLAIIVAPYRALCHEIHNSLKLHFAHEELRVDELTDVIQMDFNVQEMFERQQVIIVTPEKLNYILRNDPNLANRIGLIIYDEGHLFDDVTRGVTYELLLALLKSQLPTGAQTILMSAVIKNADDISRWLLPEEGHIVSGIGLTPTYRTIAFVSWKGALGRLEFVQPEQPEVGEFFVPRVISQHDLQPKGKERNIRRFPEKTSGGDVALYLGLKLVPNGSVAIFTGRKDSASNLSETIIDKYKRGLDIDPPAIYSDADEIQRLVFLYKSNLGPDSSATIAASLGVFMHHGNTPHGIRLAVEHALQKGLVKLVICTSTLAQGVNLPLRYLIITHARLGRESIRTRDFHNLIGRAGRSGMYTEGTIIFANPEIFDNKYRLLENWRWKEAVKLLNPVNSEPCSSHILKLFDPLYSDDLRYSVDVDIINLIKTYINNPLGLERLVQQIEQEHSDKGFTIRGLHSQIEEKLATIAAIESYLITALVSEQADELGALSSRYDTLVEGTLAYYQASDDQKQLLKDVFRLLANNIVTIEPDSQKRRVYSQMLIGINECKKMESWLNSNLSSLEKCTSAKDVLDILWSLVSSYIKNSTFKRCRSNEDLKKIAHGWILGNPFHDLFPILKGQHIGRSNAKIEHLIDICENAIGYDGSLIVGAIRLLLQSLGSNQHDTLINHFNLLQRCLKYGLPSKHAIIIFELGFADRSLSMKLSGLVSRVRPSRSLIQRVLMAKHHEVDHILNEYPSYFRKVWELIRE